MTKKTLSLSLFLASLLASLTSLSPSLTGPAPSPYQALAAKNGIFYTLDGNGFFPRLLNAAVWDSTLAPERLPIIIGHEFSGARGGGPPQEWGQGGPGGAPPLKTGPGPGPPMKTGPGGGPPLGMGPGGGPPIAVSGRSVGG